MLSHVEFDLHQLVGRGVAVREPWSDAWSGVLLHGFGAGAQDLVSLCPLLGGARRWLFPHAPVAITVGGMSYGRAWFPREEERLQEALYGGYFLNLRALEPQGLSIAALELREFLDQQGVAWERLILGGFSQGAMVTAEILRQGLVDPSMPLPAVALLFSGALVAESWWAAVPAVPADRSLPPVFQSHGTHDPVLPLSEGQALRDVLATVGFSVTWQEFEGRHEIPQTVVDAAAAALPPLG